MTYDIAVSDRTVPALSSGPSASGRDRLGRPDRLLILLGSHRCAPDTRNPWSSEERQEMIAAVLTAEQLRRVTFIPLRDHLYSDNLWLADVQQKVLAESEEGDRVVLVAHRQGRSSSYLDLFPQWDLEEVPVQGEIRSSAIREAFFSDAGPEVWGLDLPAGVHFLLEAYRGTERYRWLQRGGGVLAPLPGDLGGRSLSPHLRDGRCGGGASRATCWWCAAGSAPARG